MKIKYITTLILGLLLFVSCENFLDRKPKDFLTPDKYYYDDRTVNNGIIGVYNALQSGSLYGLQLIFQFVGNTDIEVFNRDINGTNGRTSKMNVCAHGADNSELYSTWVALYDGIGLANSLIEQIPGVGMEEKAKMEYLAEARALRGLFYLNLVTQWNDVPIRTKPVTSPTDIHITPSPMEDVYKLVLEDFEFAVKYLPSPKTIKSSRLGRLTNTAIMGLLARTNLYMAGYPLNETERYGEVIKWCNSVIDEGFHVLNSDYKQIFINHSQDVYDPKENMFEISFRGLVTDNSNETGQIGIFNGIKSESTPVGYSYGLMYASPYLYDIYKKTDDPAATYAYDNKKEFSSVNYPKVKDSRATRVIANFYVKSDGSSGFYPSTYGQKYPGKWRRSEERASIKSKNYNSTNFPLIRYSDVLLMLAEGYNAQQGVRDDKSEWAVNQVRRRAFNLPLDVVSAYDIPANLSKEDFLKYIQDERARELCFEGVRKLDLIRWGIYVDRVKEVVQAFPNFAKRNAPASGAGSITNENIGRACQIYDFIQNKHTVEPIPQRELGINDKIEQHTLWR